MVVVEIVDDTLESNKEFKSGILGSNMKQYRI